MASLPVESRDGEVCARCQDEDDGELHDFFGSGGIGGSSARTLLTWRGQVANAKTGLRSWGC